MQGLANNSARVVNTAAITAGTCRRWVYRILSGGVAALIGSSGRLLAADGPSPAPISDLVGLHWVDGLVVGLYAAAMLGLGWYFGRQQKNTDEYFVGTRSMNPLLVGVSLFATLFSTISYLSTPGELIRHGPVVLTGTLSIPFGYYVVGHLMVPVYMQHRVTSAYELLEARLGLAVRLTGATLFVLLRLTWMAILIFFASSAMLVMMGLEEKWLPAVTMVTGIVAICYSSLGGLRAVVITDVCQFSLLFGGAVLVVTSVSLRLGGFGWIPTRWNESWDTQPVFSVDPSVRVTMFGSVLYGALWWICTAGGDQTAIQRFMATGGARAARRSFLTNSIAGASVSAILALVGFALLGYFQAHPQRLGVGLSISEHADKLFPYYISHHLPIGISGVVVSGLFAAAMSSLDSGVNSITAVVTTDFGKRLGLSRAGDDRSRVRSSRLLAFGIGMAVVTASAFMQHVPGSFLEMTQRTIGLFVAPLFTLFFLALFVPFATQIGTIGGALTGLTAGVLAAYWEPLMGQPVSFQWVLPISLATGTTCGCMLSVLTGGWRTEEAP